jgi:tRNA(Arg) A34 adenosine deaminase TadA
VATNPVGPGGGAADADLSAVDRRWLAHAVELSRQARVQGHHPFGAVVVDGAGRALAEALNGHATDRTCHAEMNAVRAASAGHGPRALAAATLYSSAEPCAMCAGAIYWAGIGRVVYALSEARLLELTGADPENPTLALPCREVFARGQRAVEVVGPALQLEAERVHAGFWRPPARA